jgi:outer membrane protein insertion porin family
MGLFMEENLLEGVHMDDRRSGLLWRNLCVTLIVTALCLLKPGAARSEEQGRVAVLPFRIHALEPLDHLRLGLQEMLSSRMADRGFRTISPETVNKHGLAFLPVFELGDMLSIGKELGADWVISGSLTQIGRKVSLDLKVVDTSGAKPTSSVFIVEEDMENLPDAAARAAKSVHNLIAGAVQIDSVRVGGNVRIESEAILAVIESKKGDILEYDQLDKDLRAIYGMGFFTDVNIETEDGARGKIVTFNVAEKPSIGSISFEGNKEVGDEDLAEECGIRLYSILDQNEIKRSIGRLREFYRQKGYYHVEITEKVLDRPNNEVSLVYEITEGEKIYITKIEFVGNEAFDDDELKDIMETREKGFLSWLLKWGRLDKKALEFDISKITSFYHNHGYIKARVGEPKITYVEGEGLNITIEVGEGEQYGVGEVEVTGDLIKPADALVSQMSIGKEKFFNREVVRKDTLALKEIYANEGFAYADIGPRVKEDDEKKLVDITYNVSKGGRVRFERINITGNNITRDKVIRREFKVFEGDYFSGKDLKRSIENINRLGFFENVDVQTKKGSQDDLMVVDVSVKERPTGSFSVGAGYSSYEEAIGMFQISQNNLFGRGQRLVAAARIGGRSTQFNISFTEPWFLDKPIMAGIDLIKWEYEYVEYTKDSIGGALRFGFPVGLGEYVRGYAKYEYDDADIYDIAEGASLVIQDMQGRNVTSSMSFALERDSRDRPWFTTRGSLNKISFEYAGDPLGGDVAFNKYMATSSWFFPLPWETAIMVQGRWGYIDEREEDGKLPIYQKFRIGGLNTVRGFETYEISPRDPVTGDAVGGEKMMIYNFEYRFPLPLFKEQGVSGVVFFDAGSVSSKDESYPSTGIRTSFGGGVRWYSPMGPLRIEYGKNLDPELDEPSGVWEFSMGGSF